MFLSLNDSPKHSLNFTWSTKSMSRSPLLQQWSINFVSLHLWHQNYEGTATCATFEWIMWSHCLNGLGLDCLLETHAIFLSNASPQLSNDVIFAVPNLGAKFELYRWKIAIDGDRTDLSFSFAVISSKAISTKAGITYITDISLKPNLCRQIRKFYTWKVLNLRIINFYCQYQPNIANYPFVFKYSSTRTSLLFSSNTNSARLFCYSNTHQYSP